MLKDYIVLKLFFLANFLQKKDKYSHSNLLHTKSSMVATIYPIAY